MPTCKAQGLSSALHSVLVVVYSRDSHQHSLQVFCCVYITQEHSCVLHSIVGWDCILGAWSRIEGYPSDLNPNDPVAKIASESLFNVDGRLNPSITILGNQIFHC